MIYLIISLAIANISQYAYMMWRDKLDKEAHIVKGVWLDERDKTIKELYERLLK